MKRALIAGIAGLLSACATDRYSTAVNPQDLKAIAQEPVEARPIQVAGIDIWDSGVPSKKFKVLGIIRDVRRNVGYDQRDFYNDISTITRKHRGDGAIIVLQDSKTTIDTEDCVSETLTPSECADESSGGSYSPEAPSGELTIYNENRQSNQAPLEYRESHALVVEYLN
jgi:hypothetical protein